MAVEQALKGGHRCKLSGMSDGSKPAWCRLLGTTVRRLGGLEDGSGGGRRPKGRSRRQLGSGSALPRKLLARGVWALWVGGSPLKGL